MAHLKKKPNHPRRPTRNQLELVRGIFDRQQKFEVSRDPFDRAQWETLKLRMGYDSLVRFVVAYANADQIDF